MTSHQDIIRRWRDVALGKSKTLLAPHSSNIRVTQEAIYSYGTHFPLAETLRDEDGFLLGFLLNGDSWGPTTSRHQRATRDVLERGFYPTVVIPYSALRTIGIGRPREVRIVARNEPTYVAYVSRSATLPGWVNPDRVVDTPLPAEPEVGVDGWHQDVVWHREGSGYVAWNWRHVLEEAVISYRGEHYLSGIDHQDFTYFLVRLPRQVSDVADAYDSLMPTSVRLAKEAGLDVLRQGDIFFIPTDLTTRALTAMGVSRERGGDLFRTNHRATEVARADRLTFVRGIARHRPLGRRPDHKMLYLGDRKTWYLAVRNAAAIRVSHDHETARTLAAR